MFKHRFRLLIASIFSVVLVISGCSSDGGGDGGSAATEKTTVSGKVTLSSVVSGDRAFKARNKAIIEEALKAGQPGTKAYQKALAKASARMKALGSRALVFGAPGGAFENGIVRLYDAAHPEWIYPVAEVTTDTEGNYELAELMNAAKNGDAYVDGDPIPAGVYTMLALKFDDVTNSVELVALQSVASEFTGVVPAIDLVAQTSDAEPKVTTMLGVSKNTDGTQTWGDNTLELAPNAALQVAFSMPMNRPSIVATRIVLTAEDGSTPPAGTWSVSGDWLTATFYLDEGQEWTKGVTYNMTANGEDGDAGAVFNVYGKPLKLTAVGTFSVPVNAIVDTQKPTATISSPTLAATANPIEVITPIRIASNERMDVNNILLISEPSLGARPGVLFVGKNADELYEYEFLLGDPLKLGTTYDVTVSGGTDLAGNEMNPLTVSFSTVAQTEGVAVLDDNATADEIATVNAQVDVKDIFGKWIRAMNDRNLPQLQSVMAGDFFMEYNAATGFDPEDVNRDGLFDLREFSDMMTVAFTFWDFCGVTVTGTIPTDINIVGDTADFEFVLGGSTDVSNQDCKESVPQDSLFATLQRINGAWFMIRASEGIDTRGQEIAAATVLNLVEPAFGSELELGRNALGEEVDVTFTWEPIEEAASYAMIFIDSRNPQSGFAIILPSTETSFEIPSGIDEAIEAGTIAEISEDFGFTDGFEPRPGSEVYWQIAALGSNTVRDVQDGRQTSLPKDVVAMSELSRFKIVGDFVELGVVVNSNSGTLSGFNYDETTGMATSDGADGAVVTFSELIRGYDLAAANVATITVTSPREGVTSGAVIVDGNTHKEYCFEFDANGVGMVTIALNQGVSNVGVMDDSSRAYACNQAAGGTAGGDEGGFILEEWFQITSTGGIPEVIGISTVADQDGVMLTSDGWDFYESTTATSLTVTGSVDCVAIDCMKLNDVRLELWNDQSNARASRSIELDRISGDFTVDVDVYKGENWINVHTSICSDTGDMCENFNANFGFKTGVGVEYIAPISDIVVMDDADDAVITQKENWGDGGMWDVSAVTGNIVTVTGVMEFATDNTGEMEPAWEIGSEGGWQSGQLSVALDGTFSLTVELFNGWNYVRIRDVQDNWFNIDMLTTLGKVVIRPTITMLDSTVFTDAAPFEGEYSTTQCKVSIQGTAMAGEMRAYWNGNIDDPVNPQYFWEEFVLEADDTGVFSLTIPVIGSSEANVRTDNFIDIFDKNWNWMGVHVINSGNCMYTAPAMTIDSMVGDLAGAPVALVKAETFTYPDPNDQSTMIESGARFSMDINDPWMTVDVDSVMITGTSTVPGRKIAAEMWICNRQLRFDPVTASETETAAGSGLYEWMLPVTLYPGYNNVNVMDGKNWYNVEIQVNNTNDLPAPPVAVTLMDGTTIIQPAADQGADPTGGDIGTDPTGAIISGDPCEGSMLRYDVGALTMVTVSGTTTGTQDGEGEWNADGSFGRFPIVAGAFSFEVSLFDGFTFININDADWNNSGIEIFASNGAMRPRYVDMTNDETMMPSGMVTITGTIYGKSDSGTGNMFVPKNIGANMNFCDENGCNWFDFSSDPNAADWGAMPMMLEPIAGNVNGDYTFSFEVDFMEDANNPGKALPGRINVWTDGDDGTGNGWQGHGMDVGINDPCADCNAGGNYWKPGKVVKKKGMDMKTLTHIKAARSKGK